MYCVHHFHFRKRFQLQEQLNQVLTPCQFQAKFKIENKELLTYLLYESSEEEEYVKKIKCLINKMFLHFSLQATSFSRFTFLVYSKCVMSSWGPSISTTNSRKAPRKQHVERHGGQLHC